ncbi:MAG: TIGR02391 family protein [Gemmataceae bacterium]|nr:TIGR02391 family protein [Gemmataceae bacterium]
MTITFNQRIPPFAAERLEAISKVLADTNEGLTGTEIDHLLRSCNISDPTPDMTKWKRLHNAFVEFQNEHQVGNHVVVFIKRSMDPARYVGKPQVFRYRRDRLNSVLAFCGYTLGEDGQLRKADAARTISEALERANRLHAALIQRSVHADVLKFCKAELLEENYFHAVFEAMKSVTAKIRTLTGMTGDGCDLVHDAFGQKYGDPLLVINSFQTETHKGEQYGFMNLLKGLYGTIRNPLAHTPKTEWDMTEQDALDILTMISLVHRKLDQARRFRP